MGVSEVILSILLLILIVAAFNAVFIVHQRHVGLVTRFGKHIRTIENPGLHIKIPFIDKVEARISTAEKQAEETLQTKTSDDLFVDLPIAIHYEVSDSAIYWFDKGDAVKLMKKVVAAAVREYTSGKDFQELYNERQEIKDGVMDKVFDKVSQFGIQINDIVIDEPAASSQVKATFDRVRASALEKEAAVNEAAADKIRIVAKAEADKERNILIGEGVAGFREKIASGYTHLRKQMVADGIDPNSADLFMSEMMHLDTIRDVGDKGNMVIVTETGTSSKEGTDMAGFIAKLKAAGVKIDKTVT